MRPIKIFCSFASDSHTHRDKNLINRLLTHLDNLERQIQVSVWHAHKIAPGLDLRQEASKNLRSANIILLCISPDYMASDSCRREAIQAVRLERAGRAIVRIIPLRHVDWENTSFSHCEVLPKSRKFVSGWSDKDEVFHEIAQNIKELVQELRDNQTIQEFNRTHLDPLSETHTFTRTATPPVMPGIEELRINRQTDEVILERQTEDFRIDRRTEDPKPKKSAKRKRNRQAFAAAATTSRVKKPLPRTRRRKNTVRTSVHSTEDVGGWFSYAYQQFEDIREGNWGIAFYGALLLDVAVIPTIIGLWANSWLLSGLAIFISLAIFIGEIVYPNGLIAIFAPLLYGGCWAIIIYYFIAWHYHYIYWYTLIIVGVGSLIALMHFLLFRRHHE